jgi:serine/threonine-protein kinase RsbW
LGQTVKLKLSSRITYVDLVHQMTEEMARRCRFPKPAALDLALAVREAFINAVKHGNGFDEAKQVEVEFERNASRFLVSIRDEGSGFDPTQTADPRAAENLERTSGRGIFFMKSFVDEVSFQRRPGRGMEVLLVKNLAPPAKRTEEPGGNR